MAITGNFLAVCANRDRLLTQPGWNVFAGRGAAVELIGTEVGMSTIEALRCGAVAAALVTAAAASFGWAQAPEVRLPETKAGRIAAAYLEAFNTGERDAMRAFEAAHRANAEQLAGSLDARLLAYKELYEDWGRLTVDGVFESEDLSLTIGVLAAKKDDFLRFHFELEPKEPYKLFAIRIERGGPRPTRVTDMEKPTALDGDLRAATINRVAKLLKAFYVFADIGEQMSEALNNNLAAGAYDDVSSAETLAQRLTDDLRAICRDKHLRVTAGHFPKDSEDDPEQARPWERAERENYGFEKVERLPGNIGYLKFNQFSGDPAAQPTAAAAMNFVKHTDALIFDLRDNGGGSPDMIVFLSNYLFDKRVHLNSFYNRREDSTRDTFTSDEPPPGGRYGTDKPVFVLTSSRTFSGAEEFTYNLKNLQRATIVGETTGGGAHPVERHRINDHFAIMVPYARAINPITKTNWEGVGVSPDVAAARDDALHVARRLALTRLIEANPPAPVAEGLQRELNRLSEAQTPPSAGSAPASDAAGDPEQPH